MARNKYIFIFSTFFVLLLVFLATRFFMPDDDPLEKDGSVTPKFIDAPSALPQIPYPPKVGLEISSDTVLDKDYHFDHGDYHILAKITASNVTLDCKGHTLSGKAPFGLEIQNISDVTIKNCRIKGVFHGFNVGEVKGLLIKGGGVIAEMNGMHVINSTDMTIENLEIKSYSTPPKGYGIEVKSTTNLLVKNCRIENFDQGLLLYDTTTFLIKENTISNIIETGIGTFQMGIGKPTGLGAITNNDISNTLMGLEIHTGSFNIILERNRVTKSNFGIKMDDEYGTDRYSPVFNILYLENDFSQNSQFSAIDIYDKSTIIIKKHN